MYYTYVLQIKQDGKFYTGFTKNLKLFNRVNQEALAKEFDSQKIPYRPQPIVKIFYKGSPLDKIYQPDFICFGEVIAEIKAISQLSGIDEAQIINYLKATQLTIGLLINFGTESLEYKRLIYSI